MQQQNKKKSGLAIAGLRGGTGKTVISLGIIAAWRELGIKIAPFKKGPDYIDAGWLAKAAGRPCYNLDTFFCTPLQVKKSFLKNSLNSDIAIIEGNRGLYDCIDVQGETSTAEIAKLLKIPLLLIIDCTKATRTIAALVMGCMHFDPDLNIMGIVLNRVAGKRHEGKVRDNIEKYCNIPVFGAVPKLNAEDFPERHMGLIPSAEHLFTTASINAAAKVAKENINLDALYSACQKISDELPEDEKNEFKGIELENIKPETIKPENIKPENIKSDEFIFKTGTLQKIVLKDESPVIGVIKDSAFQFYYPDNLDALEKKGAVLKVISPLKDRCIPHVDAIYMGGGFPETHAAELAANKDFRDNLKKLARHGLPIYAECGGLIFLGKSLLLEGTIFPMSGVLPIAFGLSKKPVGHGYTKVKVVNDNSFFKKNEIIKGHEFRYSTILDIDFQEKDMAFYMERGKGIIDKRDGFCWKNVLGTYTHIHALGTPSWADAFINKAIEYKKHSYIKYQ
ncbi:MAG: cobyrinate a,c-diamide synthase [Thermodesulfobacteriota bacterium]|nr:cobyrinate a,c-diamide synthase [Thermodesulfobacteriota bacterium]